jgi:hypothetical protein
MEDQQGRLDAELLRAEFAGADAAGSAQGSYRNSGDGPGSIDLTAVLTRADARAVWRYLPAAINVDARHWVRDALKQGTASEARLILKGDLANFPFSTAKQGQFLVTVKAQDVTLDYGTGWPVISGIDADLRFAGVGMVVHARRGSILGASLSQTSAEIPDFDAPVSTLKVKGRVDGETAEFLKFIEESPVAAQIDHFTENMSASGKGRLEIALLIPLEEARLGDSEDRWHLYPAGQRSDVDPALPAAATGQRQPAVLGEGPARSRDQRPALWRPADDQGRNAGRQGADHRQRDAGRRRPAAQPEPALVRPALSGTTSYRAEFRVHKRDLELVLDSDLVGVASTLPAPLAKSASEALPLHFETALLPATAGAAPGYGPRPAARHPRQYPQHAADPAQAGRREPSSNGGRSPSVGHCRRCPSGESTSASPPDRSMSDYWQKLLAGEARALARPPVPTCRSPSTSRQTKSSCSALPTPGSASRLRERPHCGGVR